MFFFFSLCFFVVDEAPHAGQVGFTPRLSRATTAPSNRSQSQHLMLHWHPRQMRLQQREWNWLSPWQIYRSLLDRIQAKSHLLWCELHTARNNMFGLGNPHTGLIWFTPTQPTFLEPQMGGCDVFLSSFHQFVNTLCRAVLGLWSVSCLEQNNYTQYS